MSPYVPTRPMIATAIPPTTGPRIDPVRLTLLWYDTPCTACSSGMTCASNAVRAGRSKPLARPVTKMTARIGRSVSASLSERSASATAEAVTTALQIRMIERRSRRSATWPPNSTSDSAGMASTRPSQPSDSGSPVIE